jgi:hypothetical protein
MPEAVLVRFEDYDITPNMPELAKADGCIKIEPCSLVFQVKKGKISYKWIYVAKKQTSRQGISNQRKKIT